MSQKQQAIYALDNSRYTLHNGLAKHGLRPEDVTDFIYTHLHFDHAGGSTQLDAAGQVVPTFPNARHYVQRSQLAWGRNPTDKDRASFMPENWEPVADRGLLEELDGDGELFPAIELRTMHGHTQGMQMVIVQNDSATVDQPAGLVYCADLIPTRAHLPFPYVMGYDNFPLTSLQEKQTFIPEAYERRWLLCFEHDAFTDAVRIAPGKKGFEVEAEVQLQEPQN